MDPDAPKQFANFVLEFRLSGLEFVHLTRVIARRGGLRVNALHRAVAVDVFATCFSIVVRPFQGGLFNAFSSLLKSSFASFCSFGFLLLHLFILVQVSIDSNNLSVLIEPYLLVPCVKILQLRGFDQLHDTLQVLCSIASGSLSTICGYIVLLGSGKIEFALDDFVRMIHHVDFV